MKLLSNKINSEFPFNIFFVEIKTIYFQTKFAQTFCRPVFVNLFNKIFYSNFAVGEDIFTDKNPCGVDPP